MIFLGFHPIAFDNIKYLLEGHIYDLDLAEELIILDRNEWLNQAKWQKEYDITFALEQLSNLNCKFKLLSELNNIASELLESNLNEQLSGVHFEMIFSMKTSLTSLQVNEIVLLLKTYWGQQRKFEVVKIEKMFPKEIEYLFVVKFERLIYEEQMENLGELVEVAVKALTEIENIL